MNINGTTPSANGDAPSTGILDDYVQELETHLLQLKTDPQAPLDPLLFDAVDLQLNGEFFMSQSFLGGWQAWHKPDLLMQPNTLRSS